MTFYISKHHLLQFNKFISMFTVFLFFLLLAREAKSEITVEFFNFTSFSPYSVSLLTFEGNASVIGNSISLPSPNGVGRATFSRPIKLWDESTGQLIDFETEFSFKINRANFSTYRFGDGLAFFITPFESHLPPNSGGGYLGLLSPPETYLRSSDPFVAVEFDTYPNLWDPSNELPHIGIDVNSIKSLETVQWRSADIVFGGVIANARISYNAATQMLTVFVYHLNSPNGYSTYSLSRSIDLRKVLPGKVRVGFSGATGILIETNDILSWSFRSGIDV